MAPERGGKADPDKAARVRALLSNYYGETDGAEPDSLASMQPGPRGAQLSTEPVANVASTDLDSADFSVDRYLGSLLRDAHLDRLLASSTAMSSDIKSLGADMQRLVSLGAHLSLERCVAQQ